MSIIHVTAERQQILNEILADARAAGGTHGAIDNAAIEIGQLLGIAPRDLTDLVVMAVEGDYDLGDRPEPQNTPEETDQ